MGLYNNGKVVGRFEPLRHHLVVYSNLPFSIDRLAKKKGLFNHSLNHG